MVQPLDMLGVIRIEFRLCMRMLAQSATCWNGYNLYLLSVSAIPGRMPILCSVQEDVVCLRLCRLGMWWAC